MSNWIIYIKARLSSIIQIRNARTHAQTSNIDIYKLVWKKSFARILTAFYCVRLRWYLRRYWGEWAGKPWILTRARLRIYASNPAMIMGWEIWCGQGTRHSLGGRGALLPPRRFTVQHKTKATCQTNLIKSSFSFSFLLQKRTAGANRRIGFRCTPTL